MADFLLEVGIDTKLSYAQMQSDVMGMIARLNSKPLKIKVGLDIDNKSISGFRRQITELGKITSLNAANIINSGNDTSSSSKNSGQSQNINNSTKAANDTINATKKANDALKRTSNTTKNVTEKTKEYFTALNQANKLLNQITNSQKKWSSASKGQTKASYEKLNTYKKELTELISKFKSGQTSVKDFNTSLGRIRNGVTDSSGVIQQAGRNTQSLTDRVQALTSKFASWFGVTRIVIEASRAIKEMVSNVIQLDSAMIELKKVTNSSNDTYDKFLDNASTRAKRLGASLTDTIISTADYAKLGYSIKEAEQLADSAIVYKNVGDGIDNINDASESIISTMQAFSEYAKKPMEIVDKFNEVGNKYAISSKGVGDALLRSASAMATANSTLDETIALAAAANTSVQDPEKVGTALKTMSMYIRAAKTEAEDAGESTDGMAKSVSTLRDELLLLTRQTRYVLRKINLQNHYLHFTMIRQPHRNSNNDRIVSAEFTFHSDKTTNQIHYSINTSPCQICICQWYRNKTKRKVTKIHQPKI